MDIIDYIPLIKGKYMGEENSGSLLFTLNLVEVKRALSIGIITAIVAILLYIRELGSIFLVDWKVLADTGILALAGVFISSLQSFLTTKRGNFVGLVKVE